MPQEAQVSILLTETETHRWEEKEGLPAWGQIGAAAYEIKPLPLWGQAGTECNCSDFFFFSRRWVRSRGWGYYVIIISSMPSGLLGGWGEGLMMWWVFLDPGSWVQALRSPSEHPLSLSEPKPAPTSLGASVGSSQGVGYVSGVHLVLMSKNCRHHYPQISETVSLTNSCPDPFPQSNFQWKLDHSSSFIVQVVAHLLPWC